MRLVVVMAVVCLAACASEKLGQAPPAGVDFSGHWKLNEADSDDPQRLIQAQFNAPPAGQSGAPGGRSGRQGGRGGGPNLGGPVGPVMPPVSVLNEGLRWPGKQLDINQVAGVRLQPVPYRGAAENMTDLLGDHVSLALQPAISVGEHVRAGKAVGLGVTSLERNPMFGDIPTFAELGYPAPIPASPVAVASSARMSFVGRKIWSTGRPSRANCSSCRRANATWTASPPR